MRSKQTQQRAQRSSIAATLLGQATPAPTIDGPRAYPLAEARARLGIGPTKMAELVRKAQSDNPEERIDGLPSFTIGRFRYVTAEALHNYIRRRIEVSGNPEIIAERSRRVEAATAESLRRRGHSVPA